MAHALDQPGAAEVPLSEDTRAAAATLVTAARELVTGLPFGAEPLDFLIVLEEEAEPPATEEPSP